MIHYNIIFLILFTLVTSNNYYDYNCASYTTTLNDETLNTLNCNNGTKLICLIMNITKNIIMTCYKNTNDSRVIVLDMDCTKPLKNQDDNYYYSCLDNNNVNYILNIIPSKTEWIVIITLYLTLFTIILIGSYILSFYCNKKKNIVEKMDKEMEIII